MSVVEIEIFDYQFTYFYYVPIMCQNLVISVLNKKKTLFL